MFYPLFFLLFYFFSSAYACLSVSSMFAYVCYYVFMRACVSARREKHRMVLGCRRKANRGICVELGTVVSGS